MKQFAVRRKLCTCNIFGIIDVPLVRRLIDKIETISSNETAEIILRINSQGGTVPVALAFAEYLHSLSHHVVAYNMAHCDSAAILIFAAAKKRIVKESASFMFHPPCVHLNGKYTLCELTAEVKRLRQDTKSMIKFLSQILPPDKTQLTTLTEQGEHIISAHQAIRMGLATEIEPMVEFS